MSTARHTLGPRRASRLASVSVRAMYLSETIAMKIAILKLLQGFTTYILLCLLLYLVIPGDLSSFDFGWAAVGASVMTSTIRPTWGGNSDEA